MLGFVRLNPAYDLLCRGDPCDRPRGGKAGRIQDSPLPSIADLTQVKFAIRGARKSHGQALSPPQCVRHPQFSGAAGREEPAGDTHQQCQPERDQETQWRQVQADDNGRE